MNYRERLIEMAEYYLEAGIPIPLDIAAALLAEGVDVEDLS